MSRRLAVLAGALLWLSITPLYAQNPVSQETFGAGVHAYFSGDYRRAFDLLTSIIDTSADDPRAYYFRGLSLVHLGRGRGPEGLPAGCQTGDQGSRPDS